MFENFIYETSFVSCIIEKQSVTDRCLLRKKTPERRNYQKLETKVVIWQCGLGILVIMIVKIVTLHAEGN